MNLQEFIKEVLIQIDSAVDEARNTTKRDVSISTTQNQRAIEFDIAVTSEATDTTTGKAGIRVLQFAEAGGDLSFENKNSTVSRIKFGVHMDTLTKGEDASRRAQIEQYNREHSSSNGYN